MFQIKSKFTPSPVPLKNESNFFLSSADIKPATVEEALSIAIEVPTVLDSASTKVIVLLPLMVISVTNFFKSSVCFSDPKPYSTPSTMITLSLVAKNIQCGY